MTGSTGPLQGVRVIEMAGLGASPYTSLLLADMGAEVIRVDRPGTRARRPHQYALSRGRRSVTIDLKDPVGLELLMELVESADVLTEAYRPGVAERLGFGPDKCLARNPRLVYGRMTGWGQEGPMSHMAGHDLNYLALTGALRLFQNRGSVPPTPPGLLADFAGGGLMLAFGIVSALAGRGATGKGQVIDAAMVDGVASLTTLIFSMTAQGRWTDGVENNFCDGAAPYYSVYECSDGGFVAVAPIEPQFYAEMLRILEIDPTSLPDRDDPANWAPLKAQFAEIFGSRTREEWTNLFDGTDACVTPVLDFGEAIEHPHLRARGTYTEEFGVTQPSPAPRLGATPQQICGRPPAPSEHSREVLIDWGIDPAATDDLIARGIVEQATSEEQS